MLLMTHLRDLMTCEGAAMACAKRRDAFCFLRLFLLEQMSAPALNTGARIFREGSDPGKRFHSQAFMDIIRARH